MANGEQEHRKSREVKTPNKERKGNTMKTKRKSGTLTKSALSVALVLIMLVCALALPAAATTIRVEKVCDSYFEYLFYTATTDLPDNYVYFDAIADIGDFKKYVDFGGGELSDSDAEQLGVKEMRRYTYVVTDPNGIELSIDIHSFYEADEEYKVFDSSEFATDTTDMRRINTDDNGVVVSYNGVEYVYKNGRLARVKSGSFTLSGDLSNYHLEEDDTTFLAQLLTDPENAHELFEDFRPGGVYKGYFWILVVAPITVAVAAVAVAAVYAVKRHKRGRRATL